MVRNNLGAGLIQDTNDIALYVKDIVILCAVIVKPIFVRFFIVQEDDFVRTLGLPQQGTVHDMILSSNAVYGFAGAYSIGVIGVADTVTAMDDGGQPPSVLPGKGEAVTVGEGVADLIIGDGLAVKGKEVVSNPKTS